MAAIFKSSLQNLSPLPASLKVEPSAKPKTGLKFFVDTAKPKTNDLAVFGVVGNKYMADKIKYLIKYSWLNTAPVKP